MNGWHNGKTSEIFSPASEVELQVNILQFDRIQKLFLKEYLFFRYQKYGLNTWKWPYYGFLNRHLSILRRNEGSTFLYLGLFICKVSFSLSMKYVLEVQADCDRHYRQDRDTMIVHELKKSYEGLCDIHPKQKISRRLSVIEILNKEDVDVDDRSEAFVVRYVPVELRLHDDVSEVDLLKPRRFERRRNDARRLFPCDRSFLSFCSSTVITAVSKTFLTFFLKKDFGFSSINYEIYILWVLNGDKDRGD